MRRGGWIPLDKALVRELPKDRPFTRLEAMFSLTCNYDNGEPATLRGYASLWRWSTGKVERFLREIGVRLEYPETTGKRTNQRLVRRDRSETVARQRRDNHGTINFIDSKMLSGEARQKRDGGETKTRQSRGTIKEPRASNLEPEPKSKPLSSEPCRLSELLGDLVFQNNPGNRSLSAEKREATLARWAQDIDRILRIDNRSPTEVERVILWSQQDTFWKANILSGAKLREKFDQLTARMSADKSTTCGGISDDFKRRFLGSDASPDAGV